MQQMFSTRKTAVAAAASLVGLLAACGGSSDSTPVAEAQQPALSARAKSLITVDGKQFKDLNANGKLDSNIVGIPTEPYGAIRHARGRMGPPAFEDAAVDVQGDTALTIHLH